MPSAQLSLMEKVAAFSFSGFFAFRTPLLPFIEFLNWGRDLGASAAGDDLKAVAAALERDRARLREHLRRAFMTPQLREALFVASPVLDDALDLWMREPDTERGRKAERSLTRYFSRMATRPTPFGLFAGCSVGTAGATTRIELGAVDTYQRHTRLDMDYVCSLVDDLIRHPALRNNLTYRPNSSLYKLAGQFRYAEGRLVERFRTYHLVALEATAHLKAALDRASLGASPREMADAIVKDDTELSEAEAFIQELIDAQVVVPDLLPAVTGPEPLRALVARLRRHPEMKEVAALLDQTSASIDDLDKSGISNSPSRYREIASRLEALPTKVDLPRLFQVDLVKPAPHATIGPEVVEAVTRLVHLLQRLAPPSKSDPLSEFRDAFMKRYEGREVPLVDVLDEETGIGFKLNTGPAADASPLLADLPFAEEAEDSVRFGRRERILSSKLEQALTTRAKEIVLEEDDLAQLETKDGLPLPDSFSAMVTCVSRSPEMLAAGEFRLFAQFCMGPSGARLLGRFCHGDADLENHVRNYLRQEEAQQPNAIFAEIVHLPEGRIGNVIARPVLREYEIPFLGESGTPADKQILVSDLRVSVIGNRVLLRSAKLNRRVIPRLTNAHNFENEALGTYQFLCTLAKHGVAGGLQFSWGNIEASFLPRIVTGPFVLSRASWLVKKSQLEPLKIGTRNAQFVAVQKLRRELDLPRLVYLADADNLLSIDFDNALSVDSFVHLAKNREFVRLEEVFPGPDDLCVSGPEGLFAHELVLPFTRDLVTTSERTKDRGEMDKPMAPTRTIVRHFPPGSEWLYTKLYCGTATADRILRDVVVPLLPGIADLVDQWYFIRYGDPEWHVRLRFHGSPEYLARELLPSLANATAPLLDNGMLSRVQLDTYEREIERYGGPHGMLLSEQIFHRDSRAVLGIIDLLSGDDGAQARWQLGLRGMDLLLDDLGFDLAAKLQLLKSLREPFAAEFKVDVPFERKLGEKFRKERAALDQLFDSNNEETHPYAAGLAIIRERSAWLAPIAAELREKESRDLLTGSLIDLAPSLLHMHANRILRSNARAQELVMYDLLVRSYESKIARARKSTSTGRGN